MLQKHASLSLSLFQRLTSSPATRHTRAILASRRRPTRDFVAKFPPPSPVAIRNGGGSRGGGRIANHAAKISPPHLENTHHTALAPRFKSGSHCVCVSVCHCVCVCVTFGLRWVCACVLAAAVWGSEHAQTGPETREQDWGGGGGGWGARARGRERMPRTVFISLSLSLGFAAKVVFVRFSRVSGPVPKSAPTMPKRCRSRRFLRRFRSDLTRSFLILKNELGAT